MKTIHEKHQNTNVSHEIRSRLMLRGLTIRKWAAMHGLPYTHVYQVIVGDLGKLGSPFTKSYAIQQLLKSEGLWPTDEEKAA